jgi:hypothetical protein
MGTEGWGESRLTRRPIRSISCADESTAMREMGSSLSALATPDSDLIFSLYSHPNPSYPGTGTYRPWSYQYQPVDPLPLPSMSTIALQDIVEGQQRTTICLVTLLSRDQRHYPRTQATDLKSDLSFSELPHFYAGCRTEIFRSRELDPRQLFES